MLSFLIYTLGCKLNQLESESITDTLKQSGFSLYDPQSNVSPSVIIVNTCTVTSKADQKARRVIRKALRDYPASCVIVTGCYAQLDYEKIKKLDEDSPGRLFVLRGKEKDKLLDLPLFFTEGEDPAVAVNRWYAKDTEREADPKNVFQFSAQKFSSHTRSFLKIQDGCDNHCTYCRIRLARGKSVSLDAQQALQRLKTLEENYSEAVLTGVNICQYEDWGIGNRDKGVGLAGLLEFLLAGTDKIALRLSSLEPEYIDKDFAGILCSKRIRPSFHLSIQSGSEKILERMGRGYNSENIENAVKLLRDAKDDPFLACDIITGFPGETEDHFEKTYKLCQKIDFAWIHVFPYSKREGTAAFLYKDTIQENEVTRRVQLLTDLAWQGRKKYVNRWIGREVQALVEEGEGCRAISENYLKLLINCPKNAKPPSGTVLRCKLAEEKCEPSCDYDASVLSYIYA